MITGEEKPDAGEIDVGPTVRLAYVDQHRDALDGDNTVFDEISGGADEIEFGKRTMPARAVTWRSSTSRARTSRSR